MGFFKNLFGKKPLVGLHAPMAGKAVAITEVPDPTFAEKMLGNGIAIIPTDGKVYAPCDGTVEMVFDTKHAISMVSAKGEEILIHVGLETVGLNGAPFTAHVSAGDEMKQGQLLLTADLDAIRAAGLNTITPMVVCNSDDFSTFDTYVDKDVTTDDVVISPAK